MKNVIAQLGDVSPLEYGGLFVTNEGGERFQGNLLEVTGDSSWKLYTFDLDRLEASKFGLVPFGFSSDKNLPHDLESYVEWFNDSIGSVSDFSGVSRDQLISQFCSANPVDRAEAYRALYDYHGYHEADSYPMSYTSFGGRNRLEVMFMGKEQVDFIDYEVCSDCYQFHHGNELDEEEREDEVRSHYESDQYSYDGYFEDNTDMECEEDSGFEEFSWSTCDLCRSYLGGSRFRLALIKNKKEDK